MFWAAMSKKTVHTPKDSTSMATEIKYLEQFIPQVSTTWIGLWVAVCLPHPYAKSRLANGWVRWLDFSFEIIRKALREDDPAPSNDDAADGGGCGAEEHEGNASVASLLQSKWHGQDPTSCHLSNQEHYWWENG